MNDKNSLRIYFKNRRKELDIPYFSQILCDKLRTIDTYKSAKNVLIFYPLKYEINTLNLLNDNKNFFLPRVNGDDLEVCPYKSGDELKITKLKISEPTARAVSPRIIDIAIVPALSVDREHNRLGYGGGYYDRFLTKFPDIKTFTLLPKALLSDNLPIDKFDRKIDFIITD